MPISYAWDLSFETAWRHMLTGVGIFGSLLKGIAALAIRHNFKAAYIDDN